MFWNLVWWIPFRLGWLICLSRAITKVRVIHFISLNNFLNELKSDLYNITGAHWIKRNISILNIVFKSQYPDKRALLGAKFEACARETVVPHWSFVLSLTAKHTVLVPLRRDVLLPLTLSVTVPTTEMAIEADLKQERKALLTCGTGLLF